MDLLELSGIEHQLTIKETLLQPPPTQIGHLLLPRIGAYNAQQLNCTRTVQIWYIV